MNLREPFFDLIEAVAPEGTRIYRSNQNLTEEPKPYLVYRIGTSTTTEFDSVTSPDYQGRVIRYASGKASLDLNYYGANAEEFLRSFRSRLNRDSITNLCRRLNIAVLHRGEIRDLTFIANMSQQVERAQMDLTLGFTEMDVETLQIIDRVEIRWIDGKSVPVVKVELAP